MLWSFGKKLKKFNLLLMVYIKAEDSFTDIKCDG